MLYTIENEFLRAAVNDHGAELTQLTCKPDGSELLWRGDPAVWAGHSPLLFPIVGRLRNDRYTFRGKTYTLPKHGFARREDFLLTGKTASSLTLTYADWEKHFDAYPFRFDLSVTFSLEGKTLTVSHAVHNADNQTLYFSLGAHPAIAARDAVLTFEKEETLSAMQFGSDMLIRDERTPFLDHSNTFRVTPHTFDHDAYLLEGFRSNYVDVRSSASPHTVRVTFGGAPFLGLWAKPGADYVCIEPWEGLDDDHRQSGDLTEKKGIVALPAGDTHTFAITISVR